MLFRQMTNLLNYGNYLKNNLKKLLGLQVKI